jgi:hypothetical protein
VRHAEKLFNDETPMREVLKTGDVSLHFVVQQFCTARADGPYVYIYNCNQFIQCSNGKTSLFNCAGLPQVILYYNSAIKACDWPSNLKPAQIAACTQTP